jgi:antitoxin (DNA-binding transcriptional repressor) of toxin-antitoxin stability system
MPRELPIRELCDRIDAFVATLQAGGRLTLTIDGGPAADVRPHVAHRSPWVPAAELRRIRREAPADLRLLADLHDARGGLIDIG